MLVLIGTLALAGCEQATPGTTTTVRDSLGIRIVENAQPSRPSADARWVSDEPLLRIGVIDGRSEYQFSGVSGAVRLPSGGVAVADAASQQIRFFDAAGGFQSAIGQQGEGPGEFVGLSGLGIGPRDEVWAYDFSLRRITWLDTDGTLLRVTTLGPDPPALSPIGAMPDGTFVLKQLWGVQQTAEANVGGLRRDAVAYVRVAADGPLLDTLGLFPGRELVISSEAGRGVMSTPPFGKNSVGAILQGALVVGGQTRPELDVISSTGAHERSYRFRRGDLALTGDDVSAFIERRVSGVTPDRQAALRSSLQSMPVLETRPAYGPVLADRDGMLWIGNWAMAPDASTEWVVLDSEGSWLEEVATPPDFYPTDIGSDWILGVERDDLDVEYVSLYALLR